MKTKNQIIAFGDSIVRGVVVKKIEDNQYKYGICSKTITDVCNQYLDKQAANYGKLGCTIEQGEKIVETHLDRVNPQDYVILCYGGNDSNYMWQNIAANPKGDYSPVTPIEEYRSAYIRIITTIMQTGAVPIVLSLPPIDHERYYDFLTRDMSEREKSNILEWLDGSTSNISNGHELYNIETMKIAQRMLVPWIDITSVFLRERNYRSLLCDDGLHPNEAGQQLIARTISLMLSSALQRA